MRQLDRSEMDMYGRIFPHLDGSPIMPRAVPTQINAYLSANLQRQDSYSTYELQPLVGVIVGFLDLYRSMPHELINLSPDDYANLVANVGKIEFAIDRYRRGLTYDELSPIGTALPKVWRLIEKLPDRFPTTQHDLTFITDPGLREDIGFDVDAVRIDLQSGEWKGATVLAGSCCEALLLYGIQKVEQKVSGEISRAVAALTSTWTKGKGPNPADPTDLSWNLFCYAAVALEMKLITDATKNVLDTARDYRNLIHPAKSIREQMTCDRGTAYVSAGAMDHVIRDLKKNL
jgi:hypothetical protein